MVNVSRNKVNDGFLLRLTSLSFLHFSSVDLQHRGDDSVSSDVDLNVILETVNIRTYIYVCVYIYIHSFSFNDCVGKSRLT